MEQIEGFKVHGLQHKVLKLRKSIYGLKQAAREFNGHLHSRLIEAGMKQSHFDPCLYFNTGSGNEFLVLATHVNDILGSTNSQELKSRLDVALHENYELNDIGVPKIYCGMEINVVKNSHIELCQESYINEKLKEFGMSDCKGTDYPM